MERPKTLSEAMERLRALRAVEDATESFANAMLDLSIALRGGDGDAARAFFTVDAVGEPFPSLPGELTPHDKGLLRRTWTPQPTPRPDSIALFLDHFAEIDDARLKVKQSTLRPDGVTIDATIAFKLIGRDRAGRREWVRGKGTATARHDRASRQWHIVELDLGEPTSLVAPRDLFNEVSGPAGIRATDPPLAERIERAPISMHGAAAGDVNGDGLIDVVATGLDRNALYLNNGDGTFRDAAAEWGIESKLGDRAVAMAPLLVDIDNDGDPDLFIVAKTKLLLFENTRPGFRNVSPRLGAYPNNVMFSASAGDVNGDGFADLYIAANKDPIAFPNSHVRATNGAPNLLLLNNDKGKFDSVATERGADDERMGLAVQMVDADGDRDLDIYVANDFGGGNAMYFNDGEGHFVDEAEERGVLDKGFGMGVSFGDVDNDGDLDLHVTKMSSTAGARILGRDETGNVPDPALLDAMVTGNTLYENTGGAKYSDVTGRAGPFGAGWAYGGGFVDLDNDGWLDLHTPNGFKSGKRMHDT